MKAILFSCFLLISPLANANELVELDTQGGTCPLEFLSIRGSSIVLPSSVSDPSFSARVPKWGDASYTKPRPEALKSFVGQKIFVFGTTDPASEAAALKVKPSFGICVQYKDLESIRAFKERTNATFAVQLANDYVISALEIKSYPVLITVKEDVVEYSTDF